MTSVSAHKHVEQMEDDNEAPPERQFKYGRSYAFASLTALTFGYCNFLLALQSAKHSMKAMYPQSIGYISLWLLFHFYSIIAYKCKKPAKGEKKGPYFSKKNSSYYTTQVVEEEELVDNAKEKWEKKENVEYVANCKARLVPLERGLI